MKKSNEKHVLVKWNPTDSFEVHTIRVHAEILNNPGEFVWWGKIAKSGNSGMNITQVKEIQNQLLKGIETHLYLYCPDTDSPSLHVGLVSEIITSNPKDFKHIPSYYMTMTYKIPFWFKIIDIRKISLDVIHKLKTMDQQYYDPGSANFFPVLVAEPSDTKVFDYSWIKNEKWYKHQNLHLEIKHLSKIDPNFIFCIMPFSPDFDDIFRLGITPILKNLNFTCKRADDFLHIEDIMPKIKGYIEQARIIVADLSTNNPNVFYELGYAHALGKQVVLITRDRNMVPFDLRNVKNIEYSSISNFKDPFKKLIKELTHR